MFSINKKRIYLDFASITPLDKRVEKKMVKCKSLFANPSALYKEGVLAKKQIELSRASISSLLNASKGEIYFTSGGTEGNNIAILGAFKQAKKVLKEDLHMIVSSIEHSSVLECARFLEKEEGVRVTYIEPDGEGIIDPKTLRVLIEPHTFLISVQMVNNEIGVIEPIALIAKTIRHFKKHISRADSHQIVFPLFHTDACQALNYLEIDVIKLGIDLMTFDGTKIYGPRGIGALYKRRTINLEPILFGGGQENNLRSGTENTISIIGLAKAFGLCENLRQKEILRLLHLQTYFLEKLKKIIPNAVINGSLKNRVVNNINFCIPNIDAEFLVFQFDAHGIALSSASSCVSKKEDSYSYVVKAIRPQSNCEGSSLRISFGRTTKKSHVDRFFNVYRKIEKINAQVAECAIIKA